MKTSSTTTRSPLRAVIALAVDVALVFAFASMGFRSHNPDTTATFSGIAYIAAPFAIALVIGSLVTVFWRTWDRWIPGIAVWLITVFLGVGVRVALFGQTAQFSFILVSFIVLGVLLLLRRLISWLLSRRSAKTTGPVAA